MTQSRSCAALCANVEDFVVASLPHVVKLVGIHHVYWTPSSCECSTPQPWLPSAQLAMDADPKQPHELQLVCYPNEDCTGSPTSVSLMDTYVSVRRNAEADLVYTLIVVVLMVIFALAFMHALNKVNTRMLHPLWNILDDMASLRSLEAVRMTNFQPASNMLKDLQQGGKKRSTCRRLLRYAGRSSSWCSESKKEDDVKELAETWTKVMTLREWHSASVGTSKGINAQLVESRVPFQPAQTQSCQDLRVSLSTMRAALRNWAKYVPPYLLKSLYRHGIEARVGLNPNEVSIFFCDIDRFKEMCRESTPKEVLAILSLVHGEVSNAIEAQAGTLLEFVGDEVLAVFNAPNEVDDHEEHAVASATDFWSQLSDVTDPKDVLERAGRLGVRMRCGVHSGKVLVGNIGSQTRIKYGVLGDSVNVAARLKSLNSHFRTCCLVSDESLEEADDLHKSYVARPVGNLVLKGRKSPTKVWEVCARRCAAQQTLAKTYDAHRRAFELFMDRRFGEARPLLAEVCRSLLLEKAMSERVFVRGFDYGTSEDAIKAHFEQAGPVATVELWGKGAAVVTYDSSESAQAAVKLDRSIISGNSRFAEIRLLKQRIHDMDGDKSLHEMATKRNAGPAPPEPPGPDLLARRQKKEQEEEERRKKELSERQQKQEEELIAQKAAAAAEKVAAEKAAAERASAEKVASVEVVPQAEVVEQPEVTQAPARSNPLNRLTNASASEVKPVSLVR
eukprot:g4188.t1